MNGYWNYTDIGVEFGLSARTVRERMRDWQSQGFPAPLPWSRREKRWNPDAVRNWRLRRENRHAGRQPDLRITA